MEIKAKFNLRTDEDLTLEITCFEKYTQWCIKGFDVIAYSDIDWLFLEENPDFLAVVRKTAIKYSPEDDMIVIAAGDPLSIYCLHVYGGTLENIVELSKFIALDEPIVVKAID